MEVALRPMRDEDAEYARMVRWHNAPHVRQWWDPDDPPLTHQRAVDRYRAAVRGTGVDRIEIIEAGGVPVGFVQYYPWAAYADELRDMEITAPEGAWGLDIAIGEADAISRGVGSAAVRMLCDRLLHDRGATAVCFGVDRDNARAHRAYEKAGMAPTVEYRDLDTRDGERITAIWMVREG